MRQGVATLMPCFCFFLIAFLSLAPEQSVASTPPRLDEDGTIIWGSFDDITPSTLYTDFNDVDKPEGILDMAEGFANFVVSDLPYEAIRDVAADLEDGGIANEDIAESVWSIGKGFWGVIILVSIGILLFLFMPIIGLCFCCCRCCNNCGGKRSQLDSNRGCKRATLTILFVAVMGIICAGMAFTNSANDFQGRVINESDAVFISLSDALLNYTGDITEQIDYMVNVQYNFVDGVIRTSLLENQLGTDVADYIKEDLGVQDVIDDLTTISTDLRSVEEAYVDLNDGRSLLIANKTELEDELERINMELQLANASCSDCLQTFDARVYPNYSLMPEVTPDQMDKVTAGAVVVEEFNKEINDSLYQIESDVNNATNESVYEIIAVMDSTQETVKDSFRELEYLIGNASDTIERVQKDYTDILEENEEYLDYRWYFFLAVTCSILLVLVVMIIGFTMGTFCYKRGDPRERSGCSNCGGNFLMLNVFLMFVFFQILILLTCVLFAAFGLGTALCTPLRTLEFYEETIDYPVNGSYYYLGELLYDNGSYDLTISGTLTACQADDTLYNAMKLYYIFDFKELYEEYENLEESLQEFVGDVEDIPLDFDVIPDQLGSKLDDLVDGVGLAEFDADAYIEQLGRPILAEDNYLMNYANYLTEKDPGLNHIADELRDIQSTLVDPMENTVASMKVDVATVIAVNESLPLNVDKTLVDSDKVEMAVANVNATAVAINVTEEYITYLTDIGYSFIVQNEHQVMNDFAKCRNVWDIYDVSLLFSCGYVLNSFNALWFTIGWCVFFFLPAIILSVKLAKHYRIMTDVRQPKPKRRKENTRSSSDEEVGMNEMPGYPSNGQSDQMLYPPHNGYPGGGMPPVVNPNFIPDEAQAHDYRYDSRGNRIAPPPYYGQPPPQASAYDPYDHLARNSQDVGYGPDPSQRSSMPPPKGQPSKRTSSGYGYDPYNYLAGSPQAVGHGPGPSQRSSMPPPHGMSSNENIYSDTLF